MNVPNVLTLSRLAAIPPLMVLLLVRFPGHDQLAAALFLVFSATDFLDGEIARRRGTVSDFGKFLDPLADKLVVTSALIMLAAMPRFPRVPAWMVVVLVMREIAVTGLRAMAAVEGQVMAAEELGKYKMVLQAIAIQGLLINYVYFHVDFFAAGMFVLWIAMAMAIWSGADYYLKARAVLSRPMKPAARRAAV